MTDGVSTVDDLDIILMMMDKDEEGLRLLLRIHGPKVMALMQSKLSNTALTNEDIEEALYTAAQTAWERIDTFDDRKGRLVPWFFRIAYNAAIDILRRDKKHHWLLYLEELAERGYEPAAPDASQQEEPDPQVEVRRKVLRNLVTELPEQQRAIITSDLAAHGTVSDEELAERLGTSRNSVQVQRHKAKKKLENLITQKGLYDRKGIEQ